VNFRKFISRFVSTMRRQLLNLMKYLKGPFVIMPCAEHKPLNGIPIANMAKLQLRILNIHITYHQVELTKMWKRCSKSFIMMGDIRLMMFTTLYACGMVHDDAF
jgi:hypothetical protein